MYNKIKNFIIPSSASYTEFLRDYLKSNNLPNTLSQADNVFELDFKETFKQHFYMREIGFDTEELFKQKLEIAININLPYYIAKAEKLKTLFNSIFETGYSITQTNNLTNTNVTSADTTEKGYKTPLGETTDTLNPTALADGKKTNSSGNDTQTNTGTITTVLSKNPKFNNLDAIKTMQEEFKNIIRECLDSFDNLFMQVF